MEPGPLVPCGAFRVHGGHLRPLCRDFARGSCRWGQNCCFSHERKTTRICKYFQRGFCPYGAQCSYQHVQEELVAVGTRTEPGRVATAGWGTAQPSSAHPVPSLKHRTFKFPSVEVEEEEEDKENVPAAPNNVPSGTIGREFAPTGAQDTSVVCDHHPEIPPEGPAATRGLAAGTATTGTLLTPGAAELSARTPILGTSTVGTQTPAEGIAAAQDTDEETELGARAEPASLTPLWQKRSTNRAGHPWPSEPWQMEEPKVMTTQHLSPSELRNIREDFSRQEGEQLLRWLLRCWDNGANTLDLNGRQPKGLGLLAKDEGVDRYLWKDPRPLSLWKRLLVATRKSYSSRDHVVYQLDKWTTVEGGIWNLRQAAVREIIFSDLDDPQTPLDPGDLKVTRLMWHNWLLSGPPLHASRVAIFYLEGEEAPTVDFMETMLQQYAYSLSSSPWISDSPVEQQSHQAAEPLGFQPQRLGQDPHSTDTSGGAGSMADPAEVPEEPGASAALSPSEVLRARSRVVVCGICMERVYEKQLPEERLFGILPNCSHAYCVGCIRKWRQSREFENEVVKACPECRVTSSYYIPHKYWVSDADEKEKLIASFRARTGKIRCKFFVRSRGHCPFKSDCIYLHELPAGRLPRRRRRQTPRFPFEFSRSPLESSDEADEDLYLLEGAFASMGSGFVDSYEPETLFTDFFDSD